LTVLGVAVMALAGCAQDNSDPAAMTPVATDGADATPTAGIDRGRPGLPFVKQALKALKAGDAAGVADMLCPDSPDINNPDPNAGPALADQRPRLRLDPSEIVDQAGFVGADLLGKLDGEPIAAGRIAAFNEGPDGWCINNLWVIP
jgi:hypothetical protein